jgi:hypothetical protein
MQEIYIKDITHISKSTASRLNGIDEPSFTEKFGTFTETREYVEV